MSGLSTNGASHKAGTATPFSGETVQHTGNTPGSTPEVYKSFGIETTIELRTERSVQGEEATCEYRYWIIDQAVNCPALFNAFEQRFIENYPGVSNPFGLIDISNLRGLLGTQLEAAILFKNKSEVFTGLHFAQEVELGQQFGLIHDPYSYRSRVLIYQHLALERGFKDRNGNKLPIEKIGSSDDINGYGSCYVRGGKNAPGSSSGFFITKAGVYGHNSFGHLPSPNLSPGFIRISSK